ncbi:hypothetical protein Bbelb_355100 [Branchiostoma belcheri]|nr:hypothetical protein Bbelb_355100 [Branchiostoma belcheri]
MAAVDEKFLRLSEKQQREPDPKPTTFAEGKMADRISDHVTVIRNDNWSVSHPAHVTPHSLFIGFFRWPAQRMTGSFKYPAPFAEPPTFGARLAPMALAGPSSSGKNPPFKILATGMSNLSGDDVK